MASARLGPRPRPRHRLWTRRQRHLSGQERPNCDRFGLDISPTALTAAGRRAKDAGVDVKFAVADSTKLDGYTDANPAGKDWRPAVSEQTLRDVLGAAGWDIVSLEPVTLLGEL